MYISRNTFRIYIYSTLKPLQMAKLGKGSKKVENSTLGGKGGSVGDIIHFLIYFGSKWPKNQLKIMKFYSCKGGAPKHPPGFIAHPQNPLGGVK